MSIDSRESALIAARAAIEKQAEDVIVMDLRSLSSVTDFFVICTGLSARQITALAESLQHSLQQHGCPVWHIEGTASAGAGGPEQEPQWVLLDCGDIVIHLFGQDARSFYGLERLWADAPRLPIPDQSVRIPSLPRPPKGRATPPD